MSFTNPYAEDWRPRELQAAQDEVSSQAEMVSALWSRRVSSDVHGETMENEDIRNTLEQLGELYRNEMQDIKNSKEAYQSKVEDWSKLSARQRYAVERSV